MKIPNFIENSYRADHRLSSFVSTSVAAITRHVTANRMVFFPEYTDHGINHFELVLQTAFDLSTEAAQNLLTSADATVLTVSVALHDFGMHLTSEGFETLISKDSRWTWAVMGEVYGLQKHNRLDELGLKIRRVKSNLDDAKTFAQGIDYVPARIAFEAAKLPFEDDLHRPRRFSRTH
jgi:hypothetical protein